MEVRAFDLEFMRDGSPAEDRQVQRIIRKVPEFSDLIIIAHGWNSDKESAAGLYRNFFRSIRRILESNILGEFNLENMAAVHLFWPAKKYPDDVFGFDSKAALNRLVEHLYDKNEDPQQSRLRNEIESRIEHLEEDEDSRSRFLIGLRAGLDQANANPDDGSVEFFESAPEELFDRLNRSGDVLDGLTGAPAILESARRLAGYAAYCELKQRAELVGRKGLSSLLMQCRKQNPYLRLHLIGHSFGCMLVNAAAAALLPDTPNVSLSLLQPAGSPFVFAREFDGKHDGSYRKVLAERRISGPVIITHSKHDDAAGIVYPPMSLISPGLHSLQEGNDPIGGMGQIGAQQTPEAKGRSGDLEPVGFRYTFDAGRVYNLKADRFISSHDDVAGPQVAYAVLSAIRVLGGNAADERDIGDRFARVSAPRELDDEEKRVKWGLPSLKDRVSRGQYIVELNAQHAGGLPAAASAFIEMCREITPEIAPPLNTSGTKNQKAANRKLWPLRIAKSYYRCFFREGEWRRLIEHDETRSPKERAIYRLWPDFPVRPHTDYSLSTIKADAALRSFAAGGTGVIWAVIDSGIQADHPHFGPAVSDDGDLARMDDKAREEEKKKRSSHLLYADEVRDLHRSFANVYEEEDGIPIDNGPLESPDFKDGNMSMGARAELIPKHRAQALCDDFGHGTHVAGIIAGEAPADPERICAFERQFKVDAEGNRTAQTFDRRNVTAVGREQGTDVAARPLRGVAPRCKLVSLRVLDQNGRGRASQVIQALEYIRECLNDNPKLLRVHGVNLSVGYEFDAEMFACGQSPLCTEVNRLVQEGVVVVAAAGNTGYGTIAASVGTSKVGLSNTINDPGNAELAITVGATHRSMPHLYGVSYFSSKGPTGDGRLKPDLVAPGERITSCAAGAKLKEACKTNPNHSDMAYYIDDSGTSMAAPHVSGAIAAFLSIRREFIGKPLDVKRIFTESATPLGREHYFEGHGLIDLMRAIQSV